MRIPAGLRRRLVVWACGVMARREPDFRIGEGAPGGVYLERWYLWAPRRWLARLECARDARPAWREGPWWEGAAIAGLRWLPSPYLHRILRDDDDRALHDHPAASVSVILEGGYWEILPDDPRRWPLHRSTCMEWRAPGRVIVRRASLPHRLELVADLPCITLFLFGPRCRDWGFWCPGGWVHWRDFTAPGDPGAIGPGCDGPVSRSAAPREPGGEAPGPVQALFRQLLGGRERGLWR